MRDWKKRWEGRVIKVGQREETFIQLDSPLYPSSMKYFLHSTLLDLWPRSTNSPFSIAGIGEAATMEVARDRMVTNWMKNFMMLEDKVWESVTGKREWDWRLIVEAEGREKRKLMGSFENNSKVASYIPLFREAPSNYQSDWFSEYQVVRTL